MGAVIETEKVAVMRHEDLANTAFADIAFDVVVLPPLTPGEVLLEEFMRPAGLTARFGRGVGCAV